MRFRKDGIELQDNLAGRHARSAPSRTSFEFALRVSAIERFASGPESHTHLGVAQRFGWFGRLTPLPPLLTAICCDLSFVSLIQKSPIPDAIIEVSEKRTVCYHTICRS